MESAAFCAPCGVALPGRRARVLSTRPRAPLRAGARSARACAGAPVLSIADVAAAAAAAGLDLQAVPTGPIMKADLFRDGRLTAYVTAVVLPAQRLHIESYKAHPRAAAGGLLSVSPGMLVFMAALAFGAQRGCAEVYGLAIRDAPRQHARLRKYLRRFGGTEVRHVGGSIHDVPHRLLYGGEGVIVKADLADMLRRSAQMLARARTRAPASAPAE